jgi:hypothetical protein
MQKVKKKSEDIYSKGGIVILVDKLVVPPSHFVRAKKANRPAGRCAAEQAVPAIHCRGQLRWSAGYCAKEPTDKNAKRKRRKKRRLGVAF